MHDFWYTLQYSCRTRRIIPADGSAPGHSAPRDDAIAADVDHNQIDPFASPKHRNDHSECMQPSRLVTALRFGHGTVNSVSSNDVQGSSDS